MPRNDRTPLDLDAFQAFIRIAELGSFTRAAEVMRTTQGEVSLESRLPVLGSCRAKGLRIRQTWDMRLARAADGAGRRPENQRNRKITSTSHLKDAYGGSLHRPVRPLRGKVLMLPTLLTYAATRATPRTMKVQPVNAGRIPLGPPPL